MARDEARVTLDNGILTVAIEALGAEPASLRRADTGLEVLWSGDPAWWNRRAPVLFPIVGRLRGDAATWRGRAIRLGQHGFARDRRFAIAARDASSARFELADDAETRAAFPFAFRLAMTYRLAGDALEVTSEVANPGDGELPFSIGAHPGFRCPLAAGDRFEDHVIEFAEEERAWRHLVDDGLIAEATEPVLDGERVLPLTPALFDRGALVFTELRSRRAILRSRRSGLGVELTFAGFPYFGVWTKPGAPFVCLEPWCGIADPVAASGRLEDKPGLVRLAPGATFTRTHTIRPL
jgi:galactose mutarotase-like enzyme